MGQAAPRHCSACGAALQQQTLGSEGRPQLVCISCGAVSYRNPLVLVSTVVAVNGSILLCRRAQPPAAGCWAPPGGFMECGETLEEAAAREALEETGIVLDPQTLHLHAVSTLPEISEVYVGFVAQLPALPTLRMGCECLDARFFREDETPWAELAYPDIAHYLRRCFAELGSGERAIHFSRLDAAGVLSKNYRIAMVTESRRQR